MGFLDSSSSIVTAILTRKGRELIAKNTGEFRITKFAFGDDEINYQLWDATTEDDTDILNLPVLEPSSNELTALRFRLVTMPEGSIKVAYITVAPSSLLLQRSNVPNPALPSMGTIQVQTNEGTDSAYIATSRNTTIATVVKSPVPAVYEQTTSSTSRPIRRREAKIDGDGTTSAIIQIEAGTVTGVTYIDISGRDTGAIISVPVTVTQRVVAKRID